METVNEKRKEIRLRKLHSLGEDVMTGADLGGGAMPVQATRAALLQGRGEAGGRWRRRRPDWRWWMPESEPVRPPRRLLSCVLAGSVSLKV
jgi:hypothetical protein